MEVYLLSFFCLILCSSYPLFISAASSNVDQLCNLLGGWYVTPQLCHSVLDSHPRSRTTDLNGLGIIAAKATAAKASSIAADIQLLLLKASSDINQQNVLKTCLKLYTDVVPLLKGAITAIEVKNYSKAETVLYAAFEVTGKCDNAARADTFLWSSLNHYDTEFANVSWVAHAIAAYIERYGT
ncbi:hypothetical protein LUZ63_010236 [Rhynchospora breviuscula]|uniref:Pectinesterase inhibitor domain-containing protein n=1 Tax=Rhynchospora breviuscula TaxID=2022672 RepID=A0A9Q0HPR9_9POAL|nr:hypothetical protein LUZ63_010236 [Rhynchospora breviuscula]